MRCRQLIAAWCFEKGKKDEVVTLSRKEGKSYVVVKDFNKLRELFGKLLGEIQRIKSEGDYPAGRDLVEKYGVKVDQSLHKEVLERYEKLKLAPYSGFVNPVLQPVMSGREIIDIAISYTADYTDQMLHYSENYSYLL